MRASPAIIGGDLSHVFHTAVQVFLKWQYCIWLTFGCKCVFDVL